MLSIFAKFLLVSTSLSPVLGAVAINQLECGKPWTNWIWWIAKYTTVTWVDIVGRV